MVDFGVPADVWDPRTPGGGRRGMKSETHFK